jgi:hypothetical protein
MMRARRRFWTVALGAWIAMTPGAVGCNGKRRGETMQKDTPSAATDMERIRQTATAFAESKGWRPDEYRFEYKSQRPDAKHVVHLIYLEDERAAVPGGGQSVELFIDPTTFAVAEVYRFQ